MTSPAPIPVSVDATLALLERRSGALAHRPVGFAAGGAIGGNLVGAGGGGFLLVYARRPEDTRQAMAAADRMAIAWFTLRSRRYLSAVRPFGDVMLLTTMVHADEIVGADFWIPDADSPPTDKELKMARLLIDTLSGPFEPERYPDEHRRRVLDAIEAKGPPAAVAEGPPSPTRVLDLMAALEASVKAAKAARTKEEGQTKSRRRRSNGA